MADSDTVKFMAGCFPVIIPVAVALIVGLNNNGFDRGVYKTQQEAVKVGVAIWVPDANGAPKFEWKVPRESIHAEKETVATSTLLR